MRKLQTSVFQQLIYDTHSKISVLFLFGLMHMEEEISFEIV